MFIQAVLDSVVRQEGKFGVAHVWKFGGVKSRGFLVDFSSR